MNQTGTLISLVSLQTWRRQNNHDLFSLPNYHEPHPKFWKESWWGVVEHKNILDWNRSDLQMAQDFIANIFIETEIQCLNTTINVIIGLIYRLPDSDTIFFNQEQWDILQKNTKENKFISSMDDYYDINILKCSKNEYIEELLHTVMQMTWFLLLLCQSDLKQGH